MLEKTLKRPIKVLYWLSFELECIGNQTARKSTGEFLFYSYAISVQIFMGNSSIISAVSLLIVFYKRIFPVSLEYLHRVMALP